MPSTLALDGGQPVVPSGMVQSWPPLTQADREAVLAVFDSGHLHGTSAPKALELQEKWAAYVGTKYALVTNSGTASIHMAVAAAGLGPGDEVITSAFTYWSTAAAVLHHNAVPVFVDIDPRTYTMDPALIEERITGYTRAILPVHIHGMVADMDPIREIARKHNLVVIEDACQAHGATYKGVKTGALGDIGCFSCNRSKNLSGGEGGLWTTDNEEYLAHAAKLREFGEVVLPDRQREYNAYGLGWMYRPHEFVNAFILAQLERLDEYNAQRRQFANYLTKALAEIPGFEGPYTPDYADPCYFSYVVSFEPQQLGLDVTPETWKRAVQKAAAAEGIGLGQWQTRPVPSQDVFRDRVGYGKGCPWTCPYGSGQVRYDEEYPRTLDFIAGHAYLSGVYPPNTMELMKLYVDGFQKLSENAERVLELARD
ncbi:MAG: DegT/DnrJ/EryC1/StrS family aminotransferase [Armatimonadetes bacterium]|nr:DegT/DnrJ/EryC1/StrS family aminotransferase [Armatimonadota bacterium]